MPSKGVMQSESSAGRRGTCCCCFPLRMGVLSIATFTFCASWFCIFFRGPFNNSLRLWRGGYVGDTIVYSRVVEFTAWPFALMGILGAWDLRASRVKIFQQWQIFYCIYHLWQAYTDYTALQDCDKWRTDLHGMMAKSGVWNEGMYKIATGPAGSFGPACIVEQYNFKTRCVFIYTFLLFYWAYVSQMFLNEVDAGLKYLLRIPAQAASGAFIARSLADKETLLAKARGYYHHDGTVGEPIHAGQGRQDLERGGHGHGETASERHGLHRPPDDHSQQPTSGAHGPIQPGHGNAAWHKNHDPHAATTTGQGPSATSQGTPATGQGPSATHGPSATGQGHATTGHGPSATGYGTSATGHGGTAAHQATSSRFSKWWTTR